MAYPQQVADVIDRINTEVHRGHFLLPLKKHIEAVETELAKASEQYEFMRGITVRDYFVYLVEKRAAANREKNSAPIPTGQQFWDAAFTYNPRRDNPENRPSELLKIMSSGRMDALPLGKLYGTTSLELIPAIGCLPAAEIPNQHRPRFDYAQTGTSTISYTDGHPSEKDRDTLIQPLRDQKLRRFATLGWVIKINRDKSWAKTGHVLVMDMDDGRDHHPWMILAKDWPTDGQETADGDFYHHADDVVDRGDRTVHGVFPGDNNRTPICKLALPDGASDDGRPLLTKFSKDFVFTVQRTGGHRPTEYSPDGPSLAQIMDWYWDPAREEEVCFSQHGWEYMRYDRTANAYYHPLIDRICSSAVGEVGYFGEIVDS